VADIKVICPSCKGERLDIIAGVWVSTSGMPFKPHMSPSELKRFIDTGGTFTREVVKCRDCQQQCSVDKAIAAAGEASKIPCAWVVNSLAGTKMPLVCPECGNYKEFIQHKVVLREIETVVEISDDGFVAPMQESRYTDHEEVIIKYVCDMEGCDGVLVTMGKALSLRED